MFLLQCLIKKDREEHNDPRMGEFLEKLMSAYEDPVLKPTQYSRNADSQTSPLLQSREIWIASICWRAYIWKWFIIFHTSYSSKGIMQFLYVTMFKRFLPLFVLMDGMFYVLIHACKPLFSFFWYIKMLLSKWDKHQSQSLLPSHLIKLSIHEKETN